MSIGLPCVACVAALTTSYTSGRSAQGCWSQSRAQVRTERQRGGGGHALQLRDCGTRLRELGGTESDVDTAWRVSRADNATHPADIGHQTSFEPTLLFAADWL